MTMITMSSYGASLSDIAQAKSVRESVQWHMSQGCDVILDWEGATATTDFVAELLKGLERWCEPSPFQRIGLSMCGMDSSVAPKVAKQLAQVVA